MTPDMAEAAHDKAIHGPFTVWRAVLAAAPVARPEPAQPVAQLLFSYEAMLTEMRTHAKAGGIIAEWVTRIDFARDEYTAATGRDPYHDAPPSHPAPSAYVFSAHDQEIIKDIEAMQHKDHRRGWWERALAVGALRIIRSLAAGTIAEADRAMLSATKESQTGASGRQSGPLSPNPQQIAAPALGESKP